MEEEKAAAYYDELTRKGEAAARFKQGLGFSSSSSSSFPTKPTSFLSGFVKASSPETCQKKEQLESIQNKLKQKKPQSLAHKDRDSERGRDVDGFRDKGWDRDEDRDRYRDGEQLESIRNKLKQKKIESLSDRDGGSERGSDRNGIRDKGSDRYRDRGRSSSRERYSERDGGRDRDRYRDRERRDRGRSSSRERESRRRRSRSRSLSPRKRRRSRSRSVSPRKRDSNRRRDGKKERNVGVDYGKLIDGYDKMSPAERVKAKMKLQLSETAEKDAKNGMGSGWERFEFDKDAPLDDEEMEVADDDVSLVKHIGQSFRFSTVEAKREDQIKAAHDEAMFGSSVPSIHTEQKVEEESEIKSKESVPAISLLSDKVISGQQGSWRDRARKAWVE